MNLTTNQIVYLFAIISVSKNSESKSVDIANKIGVKKSSVNSMLILLEKRGLIEKGYYAKVKLTEKGLQIANEKYKRFNYLKQLFKSKLSISESDAEKLSLVVLGNESDLNFHI